MDAIDAAKGKLAALERQGVKPSFHEMWEAVRAIEGEVGRRFMELPTDRDGAPIRVGDRMHVRYQAEAKEVAAIGRLDGKDVVVWADFGLVGGTHALTVKPGGGGWDRVSDSVLGHHRPTVEELLGDFLAEMQAEGADTRRVMADYASRLALAGDEE